MERNRHKKVKIISVGTGKEKKKKDEFNHLSRENCLFG